MTLPEGKAWSAAIGRKPWVLWGNGKVRLRNVPVGKMLASVWTVGAWSDPSGRTWVTMAAMVVEADASDRSVEAPRTKQNRIGWGTGRFESAPGSS